jgi:hypothetical protein
MSFAYQVFFPFTIPTTVKYPANRISLFAGYVFFTGNTASRM